MVVIKNNKEIPYDSNKIRRAIIQAANQIKLPNFDFIDSLTNEITTKVVMKGKNAVSNSEIENIVMSVLYDKAPDIARQYSDYKIDKEIIIKENNKYYNLIQFIEGNNNLTRKEILLGKNHENTSLYNEYLDYLRNKYINIKKQSQDKNDKIDEMLEYINRE